MASQTAYSTWTPQKPTLFDGHYLRNRSTLDIGVLGYIGIVQHKEHSPEVLSIPPGTPCVVVFLTIQIYTINNVCNRKVLCIFCSKSYCCHCLCEDNMTYICSEQIFDNFCAIS